MLSGVLQLISSNEVPSHLRQAAAVYLKNRVNRSWYTSTDRPAPSQVAIPPSDGAALKQNLLPVLIHALPLVKVQLKSALGTIVRHDFPDKWPDLLDNVLTVVKRAQHDELDGALLALLEILNVYRYVLILLRR